MPRLDKFLQDILENTPHEGQFDDMKTFKEVKSNLKEAVASKTNLQYIRAKTAGNNHFEARRYIADQILRDSKLAMAYKALESTFVNACQIINGVTTVAGSYSA